MIGDVGSDDTALFCHTNYKLRGEDSKRGDWFSPQGTRVGGLHEGVIVPGFRRDRAEMIVRLHTNQDGTLDYGTPEDGIYSCKIMDSEEILSTLLVRLYTTSPGQLIIPA